jgi:SAM-dependent methyltransferase
MKDVSARSSVLDVGAGPGRHTLALAPHVGRVTAVDPSAAMLAFLRGDVEKEGLSNVKIVQSEWQSADVPVSDIVICSHVLYPIADVVPFVKRLAAHATERVFVFLRLDPLPTDMGLWADFYGVPLQLQPTAVDLFNLLAQIGIAADVEVVHHRFRWTFATIDEAVAHVGNSLCLPEDDPAPLEKLRALLEAKLIRWPNGRLGPDTQSARSATLSWVPEAQD